MKGCGYHSYAEAGDEGEDDGCKHDDSSETLGMMVISDVFTLGLASSVKRSWSSILPSKAVARNGPQCIM